MRSKWFVIFIVAAVIAASTVAISLGKKEKVGCSNDNQCPDDQCCIDGTCQDILCEADEQPGESESAPGHAGRDTGWCSSDADCPEGQICIDETCTDEVVIEQLEEEELALGQEESPPGQDKKTSECEADIDCEIGQTCFEGICQDMAYVSAFGKPTPENPCDASHPCDESYTCNRKGYCVKEGTEWRIDCQPDDNPCTKDHVARGRCYDAIKDGNPCEGESGTCCSGECVDTQTDANNCGVCASSGGAVCAGTSSPTCCSGICSDTQTDANNCGACASSGGDVCADGNNQCVSGTCKCGTGDPCTYGNTCDSGTGTCKCGTGDACGSEENCVWGDCECGNEGLCTHGNQCVDHTCKCGTGAKCEGTYIQCCSGACISVETDMNNCGSCGHVCETGAHQEVECRTGYCQVTGCEGTYTNCPGTCDCDLGPNCCKNGNECISRSTGQC
jgi:hypothetical protein